MRIFNSAYEILSEATRDLHEMGLKVLPKSYQDKIIEGNPDFETKELQHYFYCLTKLEDEDNLFLFEEDVAKAWCNQEFLERVQPGVNPGKAWELRKNVWEKFLEKDGRFSYSYSERFHYHNNLKRIIDELFRNPDTRQAYLPIFSEEDIVDMGGKRRIPCSLGYFFMIRDNKLSMTYIQRSADLVQHWGNDIYLAWAMKEFVLQTLNNAGANLQSGYLYHHIFSLHSYKKDWDKLEAGISKLVKPKNQ